MLHMRNLELENYLSVMFQFQYVLELNNDGARHKLLGTLNFRVKGSVEWVGTQILSQQN